MKLGERFGLIKFSSRTDVLLPASVEVLVAEGARVKGGTTIIGRIRSTVLSETGYSIGEAGRYATPQPSPLEWGRGADTNSAPGESS